MTLSFQHWDSVLGAGNAHETEAQGYTVEGQTQVTEGETGRRIKNSNVSKHYVVSTFQFPKSSVSVISWFSHKSTLRDRKL